MRIAINTLSAHASGGISAFIHLMPAIQRNDNENEYFIFYSSNQYEVSTAIPENFKKIKINYLPNSPYLRVLWEQLIFPLYLLFYKINVLYSVGNITSILAPCKIVLFIENANPYSKLNIEWDFKQRVRNKILKYLGYLSAKRATKLRFASSNSMALLIKLLKLKKDKCVTIYHGWDRLAIEYKKDKEHQRDYILTVSVIAPHKNLHRLIKAFIILIKEYNYNGDLLIIGDLLCERYYKTLIGLIDSLQLEGRVILRGKVKHKDIWSYYHYADMFILPSIEETFGLPLLEAMGCGIPVAASDSLPSSFRNMYFIPFREICGDAAQYFNPLEPDSIARSINEIISNKDLSKRLRIKGLEKVKEYSWDKTAMALINVFKELEGKMWSSK